MSVNPKNTSTALPNDLDSRPIQTLAPDDTTVTQIASLSASQQRQQLPATAEIVEIATTGNCRFAFGDVTVDSTSGTKRVLVTGVYVYKVPAGATYWDASVVDGSAGRVTVTRVA